MKKSSFQSKEKNLVNVTYIGQHELYIKKKNENIKMLI